MLHISSILKFVRLFYLFLVELICSDGSILINEQIFITESINYINLMQTVLFHKTSLGNHRLLDSMPYAIEDLVMNDIRSFLYLFRSDHLIHHLFE